MSTLQKLQCDACGGHIERASLTCQSCGMQYRIEHETQELRIITETRRTDVLHERMTIPNEILMHSPEEGIEWAIRRIASDRDYAGSLHNIAEDLDYKEVEQPVWTQPLTSPKKQFDLAGREGKD